MLEFQANAVQVHVFRNKEGIHEFLSLQRAENANIYPGLWQVVTGWIEPGETALEAAIRETKEETGLSPINMWTLPYIAIYFAPKKNAINFSPVFAIEVSATVEAVLSDEHQDYVWLSKTDTLNQLKFPSHKQGTEILVEYIINKDENKFAILKM
jgi:dihydroneopterin triphosphate diphosphatase